jgi:hypothetical protein
VQHLQRLLWDEAEILKRLYQILDRSFEQVIRSVERMGISNRNAALSIGVQRVRNAKEARDCFLEVEDGRSAVSPVKRHSQQIVATGSSNPANSARHAA